MDGDLTIDQARALVADSALWPRVREFLWNFTPQIHLSWLESVPGYSNFSERSDLLSSPRVKAWLLGQLEVPPCFHDFSADDFSRLLLLPSETLLDIAHWLGALATADTLRRVTRGPDVAALKAALPGVYPAVFSYAPYFAKSSLPPASDPAPDAIQALGFSLLHASLAHLPPPLLRRLALKLPASAHLPEPSNDPTVQRSIDQTIKLLLKLRFPEAFALCCS